MSTFPLPPVPNFRVIQGSVGQVDIIWADYPSNVKADHILLGFRLYRSDTKNQLGELIADESVLTPKTFNYSDTDPQAGPTRHYVLVAVENIGEGETPYGDVPYGEPNSAGFGLFPINSRPFGSPQKGFGNAPFGQLGYGF